MDSPAAPTRAWAQRLLASEAANQSDPQDLLRVVEKLRNALAQFVGADGFTALLRRSLSLARKELPSLETAKVTSQGHLEGVEVHTNATGYAESAIAITAHLLGLLVTFIGESLTLRLMRDVWPDESHRTTIESEDLS